MVFLVKVEIPALMAVPVQKTNPKRCCFVRLNELQLPCVGRQVVHFNALRSCHVMVAWLDIQTRPETKLNLKYLLTSRAKQTQAVTPDFKMERAGGAPNIKSDKQRREQAAELAQHSFGPAPSVYFPLFLLFHLLDDFRVRGVICGLSSHRVE